MIKVILTGISILSENKVKKQQNKTKNFLKNECVKCSIIYLEHPVASYVPSVNHLYRPFRQHPAEGVTAHIQIELEVKNQS